MLSSNKCTGLPLDSPGGETSWLLITVATNSTKERSLNADKDQVQYAHAQNVV